KPAKSFARSLSELTEASNEDNENALNEEVKKQVNKCKDRLKGAMREGSITLIEQELLVAEGLGIPWIDTVDARRELVALQKRRSEMHSRRSSQASDTPKSISVEKQSTIDIDSPERCDLAWCSIPDCSDPHTHVAAWHVCEMCGYVGHSSKECCLEDAELESLKLSRSKDTMPEDSFCTIPGCQSQRFHSTEGHLCRLCRMRGHPVKLCPTWMAQAFN
ncbi:Sir2 histone deacetylase Hst2, partial [Perkinsus olseni]